MSSERYNAVNCMFNNTQLSYAIGSPGRTYLPDFVIAGAMKCGTTSLHYILANHPKIFIPNSELFLFDIDDLSQHPDFFLYDRARWIAPNFDKSPEQYLIWYASFFERATADQLLGEDSTTYLASHIAARRLARMVPHVKIIIMLRDPASRTYSHYWHLLRTGRAIYEFEDALRIMPDTLVQRSLYMPQVQRFLSVFPRENIHFVLFEQFIRQTQAEVDDVLRFLDVQPLLDVEGMKTHYNESLMPRSIRLQVWRNRLFRRSLQNRFPSLLPSVCRTARPGPGRWSRMIERIWDGINPIEPGRPPEMNAETRRMLNAYFSQQNEGLSDLIGKDVGAHWYG